VYCVGGCEYISVCLNVCVCQRERKRVCVSFCDTICLFLAKDDRCQKNTRNHKTTTNLHNILKR